MDYQEAFEQHVRSRLEASFGKAVALLIVASASNSTGVNTMGIDETGYDRLCEAISCDQRVVDMWGSSGAQEALQSWKGAVV